MPLKNKVVFGDHTRVVRREYLTRNRPNRTYSYTRSLSIYNGLSFIGVKFKKFQVGVVTSKTNKENQRCYAKII